MHYTEDTPLHMAHVQQDQWVWNCIFIIIVGLQVEFHFRADYEVEEFRECGRAECEVCGQKLFQIAPLYSLLDTSKSYKLSTQE